MSVTQAVIWVPASSHDKVTGSPLTGPSVTWHNGWEGAAGAAGRVPALLGRTLCLSWLQPQACPSRGIQRVGRRASPHPGCKDWNVNHVSLSLQGTEMLWSSSKDMSFVFKWVLIWVLPNMGSWILSYVSLSVLEFTLHSVSSCSWPIALTVMARAPLPTAPSETVESGLCRFWAGRLGCLLRG